MEKYGIVIENKHKSTTSTIQRISKHHSTPYLHLNQQNRSPLTFGNHPLGWRKLFGGILKCCENCLLMNRLRRFPQLITDFNKFLLQIRWAACLANN